MPKGSAVNGKSPRIVYSRSVAVDVTVQVLGALGSVDAYALHASVSEWCVGAKLAQRASKKRKGATKHAMPIPSFGAEMLTEQRR
jgi:hypothetical protein